MELADLVTIASGGRKSTSNHPAPPLQPTAGALRAHVLPETATELIFHIIAALQLSQ